MRDRTTAREAEQPRSVLGVGGDGSRTTAAPGRAPALPRKPRHSIATRLSRHPALSLPYKVANRLERRAFEASYAHQLAAPDVRLSRRDGRLWLVRVDPDASEEYVTRQNLARVVDICDANDVPYVAVPEPRTGGARIAIRDEDWARFVRSAHDRGEDVPLYAAYEVADELGRSAWWSTPVVDPALSHTLEHQRSVILFEVTAPTEDAPHFGRGHGCRVERWAVDADGTMLGPSPNGRTQVLAPQFQAPATAHVGRRDLPSLEPLTRPHVFDVDLDIDLVYLWVDGSDPEWQARKHAALGHQPEADPAGGHADVRFRDYGELRYSLRSAYWYAPWAGHIYLVTDRQVPTWLDTAHPRITVVDHTQLFGDRGRLPTFNSHAIASRLHHIEGISPHYLYLNDDVFFGREVSPALFFQANGVSKFFLSRSTLPFTDPGRAPAHEEARRNVVDLLERDFGVTATQTFFHTPVPQRKAILDELEERYPEVFAQNWNSPFRSASDFEVNAWLHHYYGYVRAMAQPGAIAYDYFDLADPTVPARLEELRAKRRRDTFCINDNAAATPENQALIVDWLEGYFPHRAPFELPGS